MSKAEPQYDEETKKFLLATKQKLETLISKPPIQEKHLAKPPTKFIAAVVFYLKKEKGFPDGLFDDEFLKKEMNSDEKNQFLKQLINVVVHTLNKKVPVKIDLMVKGKEHPNNTCTFFETLAEAAGNKEKYKYKEAIERIKSGKYKDVTEERSNEGSSSGATQTRPSTTQQSQPSPTSPTIVNPQQELSSKKSQQPIIQPQIKPLTPSKDEQMDNSNLAQYSIPFSSRGQSARKAPPKINTNVRTINTQEMPQIEPKGAEGLIADLEEKEEEQIFIEKNAVRSSIQTTANSTSELKGSLMSKLIENENDIEKKRNQGMTVPQKQADEPVRGIVLQTGKKGKDKEASRTELSSLREQIQNIVSKVNPLGKTMDYIQEDLDSMQRDNDLWRKEVELQRQRLIEERVKTDQEVSSVQSQLKEMEQNILDKLEKIASLKSTVIQNDKLLKMLFHK